MFRSIGTPAASAYRHGESASVINGDEGRSGRAHRGRPPAAQWLPIGADSAQLPPGGAGSGHTNAGGSRPAIRVAGTTVSVVDQGGEPHTFTEVAQFGGGFVEPLNHGEPTVPECASGFSIVAVARTRVTQGSRLDVAGLSKEKHLFQCCIHPWMRMEVDVK